MLVVKNKKFNYPSMLDQLLNRDLHPFLGAEFQSLMPNVNIIENEKAFMIELAAPGLNKEDLNIHLEKNIMTISAEKKADKEANNGNYLKREFSYNSFKRSFNVPEHIEANNIKAKYENGVLNIELPKKEAGASKLNKTIAIS
jgi:HSP20 family protein